MIGRHLHAARGLETVSGRIVFEGALGKTADPERRVGERVGRPRPCPANVSADFSISSFSGNIDNELGPPARKASRWTSEKELSFSTGTGGAKVSVETLSGNIRLRKKP